MTAVSFIQYITRDRWFEDLTYLILCWLKTLIYVFSLHNKIFFYTIYGGTLNSTDPIHIYPALEKCIPTNYTTL